MEEARRIAEGIVGAIRWRTPVEGYCACPGQARHTRRTGARDCLVRLVGAPTIYCFHESCAAQVEAANHDLRSAIGKAERRARSAAPEAGAPREEGESALCRSTREAARVALPRVLALYSWQLAAIRAQSPVEISPNPAWQFQAWLRLWNAGDVIWIGDVYQSGKPEHAANFRTAREWARVGRWNPGLGNYTCGAAFAPGSYARCNQNLVERRFAIVESDSLSKDEVGAVFRYLIARAQARLHCIIDTGGKSLHGWFTPPRGAEAEARFKAALTGFQCDPKTLTCSQPVRLPGAMRGDKLQALVWMA